MPDSVYESILALAAKRLLELRLTKTVTPPSPSVGSEFSINVPGGAIWVINTIAFRFTASAVVATRRPSIILTDGNNQLERLDDPGTFPASTTGFVQYVSGYGVQFTSTSNHIIPLSQPPVVLIGGSNISSATTSLDAGDQYDKIAIVVQQWSESDLVQETGVIADQIQSLYGREVTGR